jgi:hypothetical protein
VAPTQLDPSSPVESRELAQPAAVVLAPVTPEAQVPSDANDLVQPAELTPAEQVSESAGLTEHTQSPPDPTELAAFGALIDSPLGELAEGAEADPIQKTEPSIASEAVGTAESVATPWPTDVPSAGELERQDLVAEESGALGADVGVEPVQTGRPSEPVEDVEEIQPTNGVEPFDVAEPSRAPVQSPPEIVASSPRDDGSTASPPVPTIAAPVASPWSTRKVVLMLLAAVIVAVAVTATVAIFLERRLAA